jgi:hypothetical protein
VSAGIEEKSLQEEPADDHRPETIFGLVINFLINEILANDIS